MRSVTININNRCPLRCRHCSVGFSETYHGRRLPTDAGTIDRIISSVDAQMYGLVILAGGEPSLNPDLIRAGIASARRRSLLISIVTAPIWAKTREAAKRFFDSIGTLDWLLLSYDVYHLEFLTNDHYYNAAAEAIARGSRVAFNVAHNGADEREMLVRSLKDMRLPVAIWPSHVVIMGNAIENVGKANSLPVESVDDLAALPRSCTIGNTYVDEKSQVHGCCWSSAGEHSPFVAQARDDSASLRDAFTELNDREIFQATLANGFIGSLTPEGKKLVVQAVQGERFSCECDLCLHLMGRPHDEIWNECVTPQPVPAGNEP